MTGPVVARLAPGPKLWRLRLSTFRGVSPGAVHSYAELDPGGIGPEGRNDYDDFTVERILTADAAAALTQADSGFKWEEGETTKRFDSHDDARAAALAAWRALKDDGDSVCLFDYGDDPPPLEGPEGNEYLAPNVYGRGCLSRCLIAVVRPAPDGWAFDHVEE